jgi:hypothetical protein
MEKAEDAKGVEGVWITVMRGLRSRRMRGTIAKSRSSGSSELLE